MPHVCYPDYVRMREIDLSKITFIDCDPEHRPKAERKYIPVPDADFLSTLTDAFNNHDEADDMMEELNCHLIKFVGGLPPGFACFEAPKPPDSKRSRDIYIYGHHESKAKGYKEDKLFRSYKTFVLHVFWIICEQTPNNNSPRGCTCPLCLKDKFVRQ